jgi:hypothetical protein
MPAGRHACLPHRTAWYTDQHKHQYITAPNPTTDTDLFGHICLSYPCIDSMLISPGLPVALQTGGLIGMLGARVRATTAPTGASAVSPRAAYRAGLRAALPS